VCGQSVQQEVDQMRFGAVNRGEKYKKLLIFSDSSAGQNKNFVIMSLFIFIVEQQWFEEIEHRF
jgi:hypothetical protein